MTHRLAELADEWTLDLDVWPNESGDIFTAGLNGVNGPAWWSRRIEVHADTAEGATKRAEALLTALRGAAQVEKRKGERREDYNPQAHQERIARCKRGLLIAAGRKKDRRQSPASQGEKESIQAHSKSMYKRLEAQGANVRPPGAQAGLPPPEITWLFTHCRVLGMEKQSVSKKWEHDIALFVCDLQEKAREAHAAGFLACREAAAKVCMEFSDKAVKDKAFAEGVAAMECRKAIRALPVESGEANHG